MAAAEGNNFRAAVAGSPVVGVESIPVVVEGNSVDLRKVGKQEEVPAAPCLPRDRCSFSSSNSLTSVSNNSLFKMMIQYSVFLSKWLTSFLLVFGQYL